MLKVHHMRHEAHFTILANQAIRDGRLSGLARSVLMELLSRPPGWQTNADQMWQQARKDRGDRAEGRRAFRQAFAELEEFGYLIRERERHGSRFETVLHLFHLPQERADDEATEGDESDPVGGTGFGTSETGTSESGTSETGTSIRRTDQGSTDVGSTDQEDSSSSAPVIPDPEPAPVAEKKTKTPETIVIERLGCTDDEARMVVDYIEQQGDGRGGRIRSLVWWVTNREERALAADLAHVRRHSAAPTVTECGIHGSEMKPYGCDACAGEIKAGDPDDIARLAAHLAVVGEKARPDLARLLGAPQVPAQTPAGGWSWENQLRGERNARNGVRGGSRAPVADHAFYSQHTDDELRARFLG